MNQLNALMLIKSMIIIIKKNLLQTGSVSWFPKKYELLSKCIIIKVSWAASQLIRMISEGSCDTEDGRNDAENSALHHKNNIPKYYCF